MLQNDRETIEDDNPKPMSISQVWNFDLSSCVRAALHSAQVGEASVAVSDPLTLCAASFSVAAGCGATACHQVWKGLLHVPLGRPSFMKPDPGPEGRTYENASV